MSNTSVGSSSKTQYNRSWEQPQSTQSIDKSSNTPSHTHASLSKTTNLDNSAEDDGSSTLANPAQGSESETSSASLSDEFVYTHMYSSEAWEGDDIERSYHSYDPDEFDLEPIQEEGVDEEEIHRGRGRTR